MTAKEKQPGDPPSGGPDAEEGRTGRRRRRRRGRRGGRGRGSASAASPDAQDDQQDEAEVGSPDEPETEPEAAPEAEPVTVEARTPAVAREPKTRIDAPERAPSPTERRPLRSIGEMGEDGVVLIRSDKGSPCTRFVLKEFFD
jgi:ribonuclease E